MPRVSHHFIADRPIDAVGRLRISYQLTTVDGGSTRCAAEREPATGPPTGQGPRIPGYSGPPVG